MPKLNLTERELAEMWSVSPKTLQRWRTEGRGPRYLKLSKRVAYPIEEIRKFESKVLYISTSERASDIVLRHDSKPMTANDTAAATDLPIHELSFSSEDAHQVVRPVGHVFIACEEAIDATKLPSHYFKNAKVRNRLEIPHYHLGGQIRFKLEELHQWEISKACEAFGISTDSRGPAIEDESSNQESDPSLGKFGLREALRKLSNGTLLK